MQWLWCLLVSTHGQYDEFDDDCVVFVVSIELYIVIKDAEKCLVVSLCGNGG